MDLGRSPSLWSAADGWPLGDVGDVPASHLDFGLHGSFGTTNGPLDEMGERVSAWGRQGALRIWVQGEKCG